MGCPTGSSSTTPWAFGRSTTSSSRGEPSRTVPATRLISEDCIVAGPLDGIRIIEVASWMFVPAGGSVLVDWGADVIKVENPENGEPMRGLITSGLLPGAGGAVNFMVEQPNRGKRSVGIDLSAPEGREVL